MRTDHYLDCASLECPACLLTDDEVENLPIGAARREADRRELFGIRPRDAIDAILADADSYRERSRAHRAEMEPE